MSKKSEKYKSSKENSNNSKFNLNTQKEEEDELDDEVINLNIQQVMNISNCCDLNLIKVF
jgi:hypothetical protein